MTTPTRAHFPAVRSDRVIVVTPDGTHTVYAATVARLLPAAEAAVSVLFELSDDDYRALPLVVRQRLVALSAALHGDGRR